MAYIRALAHSLRQRVTFEWHLLKFRYYGFLILRHCAGRDWVAFSEIQALGYPDGSVRFYLGVLRDMDLMEARLNTRDMTTFSPDARAEVCRVLSSIPIELAWEELLEYRVVNRPPAPNASGDMRALIALRAQPAF